MQVQDPAEIAHLLAELRVEHRDLDVAIEALATAMGRDELQLTRMKKRKLLLKDAIARLESRLIPDLDA
ncbi:YdcH family protein [Dyella sp. 2RAB6]|uniref:YdcH family protein n=1 Tax=Dyella sp. 2RAB6 TaxID=3232992 RepID=UPI003F92514C